MAKFALFASVICITKAHKCTYHLQCRFCIHYRDSQTTAINQDILATGQSVAHRPQQAAAFLGAMSDHELITCRGGRCITTIGR